MMIPLGMLVVAASDLATSMVSRRAACLGLACTLVPRNPASAAQVERQRLLSLISTEASDEAVLSAISALLPLDPSGGRAARDDSLAGTWELLWSYKADKFSPLLGLPRPIRPQSLQYLGESAQALVGPGRVANELTLPVGSLLLSSGVVRLNDEPATLEIRPPFRLEVEGPGRWRSTLVEAGSDAEFRALNARTAEAQQAPKNRYVQTYLETTGKPGDLRISTVASGDPVIVGSVFVHRRLR